MYLRVFDSFTVRFGQAVNELLLQILRRVFELVKLLKNLCVVNSKIARKVNDFDSFRKLRNQIQSLSVRQSEKRDINIFKRDKSSGDFSNLKSVSRRDSYELRRPLFPRVRWPLPTRFPAG